MRRKLIDQVRQMLAHPGEQIVAVHAGMAAERVERIAREQRMHICHDLAANSIQLVKNAGARRIIHKALDAVLGLSISQN